eukprot:PhF_6_TR4539/c0_g1_i1/m.6388
MDSIDYLLERKERRVEIRIQDSFHPSRDPLLPSRAHAGREGSNRSTRPSTVAAFPDRETFSTWLSESLVLNSLLKGVQPAKKLPPLASETMQTVSETTRGGIWSSEYACPHRSTDSQRPSNLLPTYLTESVATPHSYVLYRIPVTSSPLPLTYHIGPLSKPKKPQLRLVGHMPKSDSPMKQEPEPASPVELEEPEKSVLHDIEDEDFIGMRYDVGVDEVIEPWVASPAQTSREEAKPEPVSAATSPRRKYQEWKEPSKPKPKKGALIIGVGKFTHPDCFACTVMGREICTTDAHDIALLFRSIGYQVTFLTTNAKNEDWWPTKDRILMALEEMRRQYRQKIDVTVVYYAGASHWTSAADKDVEEAVFAPCDVNFTAMGSETYYEARDEMFLTLKQFINEDKEHGLANLVFADGFNLLGSLKGGTECGIAISHLRNYVGGRISVKYKANQQQLFTYYLKRALRGSGMRESRVTPNSINSYVSMKLKKFDVTVESNSSNLLIGDIVITTANQLHIDPKLNPKRAKQITYSTPATFSLTLLSRKNVNPSSSIFLSRAVSTMSRSAKLKELRRKEKLTIRCTLLDPSWFFRLAHFNLESLLFGKRPLGSLRREIIEELGVQNAHATDVTIKCVNSLPHGAIRIPNERDAEALMTSVAIAASTRHHDVLGLSSTGSAVTMPGMFPDPQLARWRLGGYGVDDIRRIVTLRIQGTEYMCRKIDRAARLGDLIDMGMLIGFRHFLIDSTTEIKDGIVAKVQARARGFLARRLIRPRLEFLKSWEASVKDVHEAEKDAFDDVKALCAIGHLGAVEREEMVARQNIRTWEREERTLLDIAAGSHLDKLEDAKRGVILREEEVEFLFSEELFGIHGIELEERLTYNILRKLAKSMMDETNVRNDLIRGERAEFSAIRS